MTIRTDNEEPGNLMCKQKIQGLLCIWICWTKNKVQKTMSHCRPPQIQHWDQQLQIMSTLRIFCFYFKETLIKRESVISLQIICSIISVAFSDFARGERRWKEIELMIYLTQTLQSWQESEVSPHQQHLSNSIQLSTSTFPIIFGLEVQGILWAIERSAAK